MAFDSEADDGVRGMTILNEMGDLELSWEPKNDEKVRAIIEKKMREGVRFFILKPVVGDVLHMRRKLTKVTDLKGHNVKVNDADVEALFANGTAEFFRDPDAKFDDQMQVASVRDADGKLDHAAASKVAVKHRTVGVRALAGG